MATLSDHPLRYVMANELHARPFPTIRAPSRAAYLAMKPAHNPGGRNPDDDRTHLIALLDRFGMPHPAPGATHYAGQLGKHQLKWEQHTEFVTYTLIGDGVADKPFDAATFDIFPADWLAASPGTRITSALIRIEVADGDAGISEKVGHWFVPESLAISRVLDDALVVAADFRIDTGGHMRLAIFARPGTGARRTGRVMQRLCEIETYKAMAMLGLAQSRELNPKMAAIDKNLTQLQSDMCDPAADAAAVLHDLLQVSSELENVAARSAYRFAATGAYETIVNQRINVLREERFNGRQTFGEFMMRRFDPAMRTVKSTESRLRAMSDRALRAGDLLRTRVDVDRSAQNQALLTSMDRRADQQLQLQRTVEGLSVVAISYYAVNLVLYVAGPLSKVVHLEKTLLAAIVTPLVLLAVWLMVKRIHKHIG